MSDGEGGEDISPNEIVTDGYLRTDSLDEQLSVHVIDIPIAGCGVFTCWIYYGCFVPPWSELLISHSYYVKVTPVPVPYLYQSDPRPLLQS